MDRVEFVRHTNNRLYKWRELQFAQSRPTVHLQPKMRRRSCTRARTSHHGKKETGTLLKMTAAFPSRIGFSHLQSWRNRWNCDRFMRKDRRLFEPPLLPILAPATVHILNEVIERIRLPNRVLKPEQLSAASGADMGPLTPLLGAECLPKCIRVCARGQNAKLE